VDNAVYSVERKLNTKPRKSRTSTKSATTKPAAAKPANDSEAVALKEHYEASLALGKIVMAGLENFENGTWTSAEDQAKCRAMAVEMLNDCAQDVAVMEWINGGRRGSRPVLTPKTVSDFWESK
jgi:hypothetical protein